VDYDDGDWRFYSGPFSGSGSQKYRRTRLCPKTRLVYLRGRFRVTNAAEVPALTLSVSFEGGIVVHLNGKEVARAHMPKGEIKPDTLAEDYVRDVYLSPEGMVLSGRHFAKYPERFRKRIRSLIGVTLPASLLREGLNVLAVELHHAPAPEVLHLGKPTYPKYQHWPRVGLESLALVAPPGAAARAHWRFRSRDGASLQGFAGSTSMPTPARGGAVVPGAPRAPLPKGFRVWNHSTQQRLTVRDRSDPLDGLHPVRLIGVANGTFSGQVVIGCDQAMRGLAARASDLVGPGGAKIPASAVQVRWGLPDGARRGDREPAYFDTLDEFPPEEVPVDERVGGAVQPVWISVRVPSGTSPPGKALTLRQENAEGDKNTWRKAETPERVPADAAAGEYRGTVTVSAQGAARIEVSVELKVIGWRLPDPQEFTTFMDLIQSPDSVALVYGVERWSEDHWRLLEETFRLLGEIGAKTVYIPLVAKTHFGNEHSMVRWIRQPDGSWKHDFSIAEKYLDLAVRHLGKHIPVVCLYVWEPAVAAGHFPSGLKPDQRRRDRPIRFSVFNPGSGVLPHGRTGASAQGVEPFSKASSAAPVRQPLRGVLSEERGPDWGTPECRQFWEPVVEGMRRLLKARGLAGAMMLGVSGDFCPTQAAIDDLAAVAPDATWVVHSHTSWSQVGGRPVGYLADIWGQTWVQDPDLPPHQHYRTMGTRFYGWKIPFIRARFPRNELRAYSPLGVYRRYIEGCVTARGNIVYDAGRKVWSGLDGIGRIGADFWPIARPRKQGETSRPQSNRRRTYSVAGLYSSWGGLGLNTYSISYVLGRGRERPVPTARFEAFREGIQEAEARIYLERVLTDGARRATLGEELAARTQELLDERVRVVLDADIRYKGLHDHRWFVCSGWQARSEALYVVAAGVSRKLGEE